MISDAFRQLYDSVDSVNTQNDRYELGFGAEYIEYELTCVKEIIILAK